MSNSAKAGSTNSIRRRSIAGPESLRDQLAARPAQIQIPPIQIPPSQVQIVRVPDAGRALALTAAQAHALASALRPFAGQAVSLFLHNSTPETYNFANALKAAMEQAGLSVTIQHGMVFGVVPHGVSMEIGEGRMAVANVLAEMLINFGVAEKPIPAKKAAEPSVFTITIAP